MYQRYHLSHLDALKIVAAIQAELEKQGKGAAIAVTNTQGKLFTFVLMDVNSPRLPLRSIKLLQPPVSKRVRKIIGNSSRKNEFPMTNYGDLRYNAWGGGVPIVYQGQTVGAVGVSGLSEAEDMELAQMGAQLFKKVDEG